MERWTLSAAGSRWILWVVLASVTLFVGCSQLVVADRRELSLVRNEPPVHVVHYRSPAFYVRIPESSYPVVGGAIYMATATDAGRKLSDDKILWQGYCQFQPGESANVEWEKLNADRGALLRATIEAAADACADRLRTQLLDGSRETVAR